MTLTKQALREALAVASVLDVTTAVIVDAARFVERLLSGECFVTKDGVWDSGSCDKCGGTGQLWDEGLEEVVVGAIVEFDRSGSPYPSREGLARAVLSALAEEVSEVSRDT